MNRKIGFLRLLSLLLYASIGVTATSIAEWCEAINDWAFRRANITDEEAKEIKRKSTNAKETI